MSTERKRSLLKYLPAIIFLSLIVVILGFKFGSFFKKSIGVGKYRTNLVWLSGDDLNLVSIDKDQMLIFKVPSSMMVPVVGMQGDLKAGVLRKFSGSEKEPLVVVKRSVELLFGGVLDGVVESKTEGISADKVKNDLLSFGVTTDLNPLSRLMLYMTVNKLLVNQIKEIEIPQTLGVVEELPDGTKVLRIDRTRLNLIVDDGLNNDSLMADTARVVIENQSGIDNMGALAEKMIKSAGGFVIEVKTAETKDGWCRFGTDKMTETSNEALVSWLRNKLKCIKDSNIKADNENEIRVVVGKRFGETYAR